MLLVLLNARPLAASRLVFAVMSNTVKSLLVVFFVTNCVLWSQSRYAQSHDHQLGLHRDTTLWKRIPHAAASSDVPVKEVEVQSLFSCPP